MYFGSSEFAAAVVGPVGFAFLIFPSRRASRALRVASAAESSSSLDGKSSLAESPVDSFISSRLVLTILLRLDPCLTIASYFTSPFSSTFTETTAVLDAPGLPIFKGYCAT
jgi:hypothetical protein